MKIALLSPYTGGNLGDAAIQEAVINHIRRRYADADISLITLCPVVTAGLHKVSSFPIGVNTFTPPTLMRYVNENNCDTSAITRHGLLGTLKAIAKKYPLFHLILKSVYQVLIAAVHKSGFRELIHIVRAYKLMRGVCLLIVSGGGQLDDYWGGPWQHPYALFKWGLIAKAVGVKYVFLSVGHCSLESRLSTFFIGRALRLAAYRSYRDQNSKKMLEGMAFTRDDVVYPDLAFSYVRNRRLRNLERRSMERVVGISPIAYLSYYGWPREELSVYESYFRNLVCFIHYLIDRGYSIVLFSTDFPDLNVVQDIVDSLPMDLRQNIKGKVRHPATNTLDELFDELCNVDYVVASRLHGVLLSHLLCIPVLAISYDRKVDTYMADIGLTDYCLDFHKLEAFSLDKAFESLNMNADIIKSQLHMRKSEYIQSLESQYDTLLRDFDE